MEHGVFVKFESSKWYPPYYSYNGNKSLYNNNIVKAKTVSDMVESVLAAVFTSSMIYDCEAEIQVVNIQHNDDEKKQDNITPNLNPLSKGLNECWQLLTAFNLFDKNIFEVFGYDNLCDKYKNTPLLEDITIKKNIESLLELLFKKNRQHSLLLYLGLAKVVDISLLSKHNSDQVLPSLSITRLAFLGDAIIELLTSWLLYYNLFSPNKSYDFVQYDDRKIVKCEGYLTQHRQKFVNNVYLGKKLLNSPLFNYINWSDEQKESIKNWSQTNDNNDDTKTEGKGSNKKKYELPKCCANVFEAFIAVIFMNENEKIFMNSKKYADNEYLKINWKFNDCIRFLDIFTSDDIGVTWIKTAWEHWIDLD